MPAFKTIGAAGESSLGNAEKEDPGYQVLARKGLIPVATISHGSGHASGDSG